MPEHDHQPSTREAPPGAVRSPLETVVVHGSRISVARAHSEIPQAEVRSRFGGVDLPAVLGGALAGLGAAALVGAVATAVGASIGSVDDAGDALVIGGLVAAVVVLGLSALAGGWVAGRAARFDGARNGLLTGLVLALVLAGLGAAGAYSADTDLPASLDGEQLTTAAVVAAAVGLLVTLLAALLGGRLGARWHRDVDDLLVNTRPGAVTAGTDTAGTDTDTDDTARTDAVSTDRPEDTR